MRFEFKPSFDRSVKAFQGREKEDIKEAALKAIYYHRIGYFIKVSA